MELLNKKKIMPFIQIDYLLARYFEPIHICLYYDVLGLDPLNHQGLVVLLLGIII